MELKEFLEDKHVCKQFRKIHKWEHRIEYLRKKADHLRAWNHIPVKQVEMVWCEQEANRLMEKMTKAYKELTTYLEKNTDE